jgi:hypothetical protein
MRRPYDIDRSERLVHSETEKVMPDLLWGDIEPLLELAVVLNGGYFTFRHAMIPSQARHDATIQYLRKLADDNPIVAGSSELRAQIIILAHRRADFREEFERSHVYLDAVLLYIGYGICIVYSVLLFIIINYHTSAASYYSAGLLFIIGFTPVFVSLALEIYRFSRSLHLFREAVRLLRVVNALVNEQQKGESIAAC